MHITEIRIAGFKSFVDPTTVPVEPGLTGVVGPNGCGKSNLLEALRWAMGASSARAMRGDEMDDLIFSGSEGRPARELAEVTLVLDNAARTAPPAFNDNDVLEVSRRLKRGAGSSYRLNGRAVRGKDIQLIFADASTGANSPALVRQGQISELIASKPQNRRRILEEAAGIAGLNARRQEAELRLRGAETNLERLTEVSAEVERQLESLKRQARKARKFKELSERLQTLEALAAHLRWQGALRVHAEAEAALAAASAAVETTARAAAIAERDALGVRDTLAPVRQAEQEAAARVGLANIALARTETQRQSAEEARRNLQTQAERLDRDLALEDEQAQDATRTLDELRARLDRLEKPDPEREARDMDAARGRLDLARQEVAAAESALDAANAALAQARARAEADRAAREAEMRRKAMLDAEAARQRTALAALPALASLEAARARLATEVEAAATALATAEARLAMAEQARAEAQSALDPAQRAHGEAERAVRELEAEAKGLERLLARPEASRAVPVIDEMHIAAGYEAALAAALGDDLNAPRDRAAALFWQEAAAAADLPALPEGAEPLSRHVGAPPALAARLSQTGVVATADGEALRARLQPGQRLVSREGHLWRWDGFTRTPRAPLAEAERLRQRARLDAVLTGLEGARQARDSAAGALAQARQAADTAESELRTARQGVPEAARAASALRERLIRAEQACETAGLRRQGVEAALARIGTDLEAVDTALAALPVQGDSGALAALDAAMQAARVRLQEARGTESRARTALDDLTRAREQAEGRRRALTRDIEDWGRRQARAQARLAELRERRAEAARGLDTAEDPAALAEEAERLAAELAGLEAARRQAADRVAGAERALREAEDSARSAVAAAAGAREAFAGARAALEAASVRLAELRSTIIHHFQHTPEGLPALAGAAPEDTGADLSLSEAERRADAVRREREALGGVNPEAEAEAADLDARLTGQQAERADLVQAIARLREGIDALNAEGRDRLMKAFETVSEHFTALFTTLFRGGQAELRLIDADDPLAAGLEIFAQPPGKRLGTLSLMSGGEQALTAAALIFAVFLSNPAPICVLDEVDAPLDDANVDRFCRMLDEMRRRTDTRFVVITHNPVTMSRMDRLFGVTMREKGVSKLVSVDLQTAENLVAAE